jgi:hypothetical protein
MFKMEGLLAMLAIEVFEHGQKRSTQYGQSKICHFVS